MEKDTIYGISQQLSTSPCDTLTVDNEPYVVVFRIENSTGVIANSTAANIHSLYAKFVRPGPAYDLVGVYAMTSTVNISDCYFYGFYGAPYPNCSTIQCDPTYANSIAGVFVDSPSISYGASYNMSFVAVTNTIFANFQGARGGNMINKQLTYPTGLLRGGDAVGIYSGLNSNIVVVDTSFTDFVGGQGGFYYQQTRPDLCTDGAAILVEGPGPQPLLKNVSGLSLISTCMYEIDTCGNYSNLMNAILFVNNPSLPESSYGSCYSFSNCSNVLVTYSDSHLSRKRSEPYTINVISGNLILHFPFSQSLPPSLFHS
eukprot:Phypoly_transcript_08824.p1 GENE.Phypoly_transcript_08824~~Phypoly_transcript_08824.p1  ORF type:complete len:315 (+),score=11.64 Phypoly_transcript_08824:220-1164(+)